MKKHTHTKQLDLLGLFITIYKYYVGFMCIESNANTQITKFRKRWPVSQYALAQNETIYVDVRALVVGLLVIPFVRSNAVLSLLFFGISVNAHKME